LASASIAAAIESLLSLGTVEFALIDVVATVAAANGLVDETTVAGSNAGIQGLKGGTGAGHYAAVLISDIVVAADSLLSERAGAVSISRGLVVEIVAWTDLDDAGSIALGSAEVTVGDSLGAADWVEDIIARASTSGGR
jgi:hypothetical protein